MSEPAVADADVRLSNIQGNIFGGFNKDFQTLILIKFGDARRGRDWLQGIRYEITTSEQVIQFNKLFKLIKSATGRELIKASWTNIAFTINGLIQLCAPEVEAFERFPAGLPRLITGDPPFTPPAVPSFWQGMKATAANLGDEPGSDNDPARWLWPYGSTDLHAMVIVAADSEYDLQERVRELVARMEDHDITALRQEQGRTRLDVAGQAGHEHFGFKDGISQPGIRGVDGPDDPADPDEGHPGQTLIQPGEFVLGYPREAGMPADPTRPRVHNPAPGPASSFGPAWTVDGSFLAFRRLKQNVQGFRSFIGAEAPQQNMTEAGFAAKLVGRWRSGAPVESLKGEPLTPPPPVDPGIADPSLVGDAKNNDFTYSTDEAGDAVPLCAHIRKVYPRDESTPGGGENNNQTHRILRRGIPFGPSFDAAPGDDDRGLLFLCYQSLLENQFDFLERIWVNWGRRPPRPGGSSGWWVSTTGGEYFFQPSISALKVIAGD
jgi:Dyp-type peroxidase family